MDVNFDSYKLLMVGAGGIGCELLKNLVLTGFNQIEVIDLDTIELSNLNRQFLFQKCHVGKPKAIIARESVLKYSPNANIVAHHDSIMNAKYNVEYFKQFSIVLNALDNKAARSHVNRLCLAANVPLIESGSAGYLGQVTLIKKDLTECYDCLPKPPAKTFPGCTIRNTPSEPIHCIVWAKHLFNQLFGAEDPDEAVSPDGEDPENMADAGQKAAEKAAETDETVKRVSTRQWAKETNYNPVKLFNKLFNDDIKYLLSMSKLWEKRKPPTALIWDECVQNNTIPLNSSSDQQNGSSNNNNNNNNNTNDQNQLAALKLWSVSECCQVFNDSVQQLSNRLANESGEQILSWDKDDEDAMNFVAAAANLRCIVFSIIIKSKFEIKSLAGNIIPAIATTNAIVAGLIVIEALKVLNNKLDECKTVYLRDRPTLNKLIVTGQLVKPNPKCYVCASKPEIAVKLNLNSFTIKQLETKILKQELNMVQPDVEIDDGTGRIIISSEEGETEDNNDKFLAHFGLTDQSRLKCDDFFQNYELRIVLHHCEKFDSTNGKEYEIISDNQTVKEIQEQVQKETEKQQKVNEQQQEMKKQLPTNDDDDDSDEILIEPVETSPSSNINKNDDKKRSFDAAFGASIGSDEPSSSTLVETKVAKEVNDDDDEDVANTAAKKLKPSSSIAVDDPEVEECGGDSINDASDAISDDETNSSGAKAIPSLSVNKLNHPQHQPAKNQDEEILIDDDVIIEENSSDLADAQSEPTNSAGSDSNNGNKVQELNNHQQPSNGVDDDDDVIECSSDDEVIEINEEDYLDEEDSQERAESSDSEFDQNGDDFNKENTNQENATNNEPPADSRTMATNVKTISPNQNGGSGGAESDDGITVIE